MIERRLIEVEGLVQGVGFRPFVHDLATRLALRGFVRNDSGGVSIDVEGDAPAIEAFVRDLSSAPPPLAVIERVRFERAAIADHVDFHIESSTVDRKVTSNVRVAPDVATCDDCVRELFDPTNRRYRYAFSSCSSCGPRLTITREAPFDRDRTSMRAFPMCDACRSEYADPHDRRFHAQTIACASCGPTVTVYDPASATARLTGDAALQHAVARMRDGAIVAVKGLGGFHLACDAANAQAVRDLRARKRREAKPLAVMVRDVDEARRICDLVDEEVALLAGPQRPIVLLEKRATAARHVVDDVAPGNRYLGVMLAYTPLHHLLLADAARPLVMTSGNVTDEPIACRNGDAVARLSGIADLFLLHDREIVTRCDDSVVRASRGAPSVVRRSRGFAPSPISLAHDAPARALGVGGHLKNTFCLTARGSAYISHHIGDLQNAEAFRALEDGIAHYAALLEIQPEIIAHDLHPDYLSTRVAERLAAEAGIESVSVQHHHAHILSCLAEHGITDPVIGVAFDGTGLGLDGAIWGGELLLVDSAHVNRLAHLSYVPLPGGDAAIRHPWRAAVAHIWSAYGGKLDSMPRTLLERLDQRQLAVVRGMLDRPALSSATSSVGRLFDAVAAILGVRLSAQFEAQAAMELEMLADPRVTRSYAIDVVEAGGGWTIDSGGFIRGVIDDLTAGRPVRDIASAFHNALCDVTCSVASQIARRTGIHRVALSGGAFQNTLLAGGLTSKLGRAGFEVLVHRRVPCNDGGLSLGQAYAACLHHSGSVRPCA